MKPKPIGIVGGAGPMAGALLLEHLFSLSIKTYGCAKDADFPEITLISFPFSEMLAVNVDSIKVQKELSTCLNRLRKNGATLLAIACNTLHAFLDNNEDLTDLIHLPLSIATELPRGEIPLVLCTSTSLRFGLHRRYFPCAYPKPQTQLKIDRIIDKILKGAEPQGILEELVRILNQQTEKTVILGCTELSLLTKPLSTSGKLIIDPLEIVANKLLITSFSKF